MTTSIGSARATARRGKNDAQKKKPTARNKQGGGTKIEQATQSRAHVPPERHPRAKDRPKGETVKAPPRRGDVEPPIKRQHSTRDATHKKETGRGRGTRRSRYNREASQGTSKTKEVARGKQKRKRQGQTSTRPWSRPRRRAHTHTQDAQARRKRSRGQPKRSGDNPSSRRRTEKGRAGPSRPRAKKE